MPWNEGIKAFTASEDLSQARRVKVLSTGQIAYADADVAGDGVTMYEVESGEPGAAKLLNGAGTVELTAAGPITLGADVYGAADGKVQALPVADGTYHLVGKAFEAATQDGEIVEIMPARLGVTTTVPV